MLHTALVRRPFANVFNQHIHSCNHLTSILAKMEATEAGADEVFWLVTMGDFAIFPRFPVASRALAF